MAVNPNEPLSAPELVTEPGLFPDQLPEGVAKTKEFYAYVRRAPDGTEHWEWYKRGAQPGILGIGQGPDPMLTTQVVQPRANTKPGNANAATVAPDTAAALQAERDKNYRETGRAETNAERADREAKPPPAGQRPKSEAEQATEAAQAQTAQVTAARAQADKDEEDWNANPANIPQGASGRRETHRARDERLAKEKKDKEEADERRAERNKPTPKQETVKGSDGKDYVRITTIDANGNPTIKIFGPDKREVSEIPGEGPSRPTVSGPRLPQIVLGQSQQALSTYHQQLAEGVASGAWSQAWANDRWAEAHQIAQIAVSEAATQQRDAESARNAQINLATTRQGAMATATNNALSFVNSINGLLPKGSPLGGQAFAALLGLNMLQTQLSGLNSIDPQARPSPLTPADLSNPARLEARREEITAATTAAAAPPPVRDDYRNTPRQPAPPAAPAPAPVAPAPQMTPDAFVPTPAPAPEGTPPALGSAPPSQDEGPVGGQVLPGPWNTPEQPSAAEPEAPPAEAAPDYANAVTAVNRATGERKWFSREVWEDFKRKNPIYWMLWAEDATPGGGQEVAPAPVQPRPEEQSTPSGGAFPPLPVVPRAGTEAGGNVQKIMPQGLGEWAALSPYAQQPQPQMQPVMAGAGMPDMGEPAAVKRARIAASPPWRLTEDDLRWAEQNGFGQQAWAVPGRNA